MSNNPYYEQNTKFVIGFAGSGKSTELAKRANAKTLILVPTHKAADVLINKGLEHVYTIHAVLKLVPTIDDNFKHKMRTKLKKVGPTDLSEIKEIFIDEFSMISLEILEVLMDVLPEDCNVTIFGDPYQLPPVTGTKIEPWEPIEELTVQYRSKNPRGTALFMKFMESIRDNNSFNLVDINIDTDWIKEFDPDTDRILSYTNKKMIELNSMVAGDSPFVDGDELFMNGIHIAMTSDSNRPTIYPNCIEKGKLMEGPKLMKKSNATDKEIIKWRTQLGMYKQMVVQVNEEDTYNIFYDPNHYETEKRLKKDVEKWQKYVIVENKLTNDDHIPTWCREHRDSLGVFERGKAWSKYLAHTNLVFNITRPYCTTVHKAQGSEFSKVFIAVNDLEICRRINPEQYKRLMYVSLSRAIDKIIFI